MGLGGPATVTYLRHILCPQPQHQHQAPAANTSCNSHHQESYFLRLSNDACSHTVSDHIRGARGWLRTRGKGCRACSSKRGPSPWFQGTLGLSKVHHIFPPFSACSGQLGSSLSCRHGRLEGPHRHLSFSLKLTLCASVTPLTAGKCSPRAPRIIKRRMVKSLFFFKVMISFLNKRGSPGVSSAQDECPAHGGFSRAS